MADATPTATGYPPTLTEVEQVELLHALSYHFESFLHDVAPECVEERVLQYEVVRVAVERILRRRAGVI
jgi:hypothetical protein